MPGPLICAFNDTLARIREIDKELGELDAQRGRLLAERVERITDIQQAREVLDHLTPPMAEPPGEDWPAHGAPLPPQNGARKRPIRKSSSVGFAHQVLSTGKREMHIDEIITLISKMFGRPVSKATLVSNLSRYVKAGDTFRRAGPNIYGLIPEEQQPEMEGMLM